MGYGPISPGGKQLPITPYKGSWAWDMEQRRLGLQEKPVLKLSLGGQWPIVFPPVPLPNGTVP